MSLCSVQSYEVIYNGSDNVMAFVLLEDGNAVADLSPTTRVTIKIGATTIDSDVVGSTVIWWTDQITYLGQLVDYLQFKLGGQSLVAGTYDNSVITVYDAINNNGIVWVDDLSVKVV